MFIKHSQRTLRSGCEYCDAPVYWGHDTAVYNPSVGDKCGCASEGKWLLLDKLPNEHGDIMPHITTCKQRGNWSSEQNIGPDDGSNCQVVQKPTPVPTPDLPSERPNERANVDGKPTPVSPVNVPAERPNGEGPVSTDTNYLAYLAWQELQAPKAPAIDAAEIARLVKVAVENIVAPTVVITERVDGSVRQVTGAHCQLPEVLKGLLAKSNVLMVGPAGTGKSSLGESAAEALGLEYYAISLSPMTAKNEIFGYMNATGDYVRSLFREAYEHGGLFQFDEMDCCNAAVLKSINAAIAGNRAAFPDGMVKKHDDFRCVASANTYGRGPDRRYVGAQQLDYSTLDRFSVKTIEVDEGLELALCRATGVGEETVQKVLTYNRRLRKAADREKMLVLVTPRASMGMCAEIREGVTWENVCESFIFRGMGDADKLKLGA